MPEFVQAFEIGDILIEHAGPFRHAALAVTSQAAWDNRAGLTQRCSNPFLTDHALHITGQGVSHDPWPRGWATDVYRLRDWGDEETRLQHANLLQVVAKKMLSQTAKIQYARPGLYSRARCHSATPLRRTRTSDWRNTRTACAKGMSPCLSTRSAPSCRSSRTSWRQG